MKVSVNEEVRSWVALSNGAEAKLQTKLAERRLAEATELVADGQLSTEAATTLATKLTTHVEAIETRAEALEARGNPTAAAAVRSSLEAALEAHERILVRFETATAADTTTSDAAVDLSGTTTLLERIQTHLRSVSRTRAEAETRLMSDVNLDVMAEAGAKLRVAERLLIKLRNSIATTTATATQKAEAEAKADTAAEAIVTGKAALANDADGRALVMFEQANRLIREAHLSLKAEETLGLRLLLLGSSTTENNNVETSSVETSSERENQSGSVETSSETNTTTNLNSDDAGTSLEVNLDQNTRLDY